MRIGIITHNYYHPGEVSNNSGILIYELAHSLAQKTSVFVLPIAQDLPAPLSSWNPLDPRSLLTFRKLIQTGTAAGRAFVIKKRIEYLLAMWALPSGLIAYQLHKEFGIPYAIFSLGSDITRYSKLPIVGQLISQSLKHAAVRFANSQTLARNVITLTHAPCLFVPTGTNFPLTGVKPVMLAQNNYHFLYVGRLEKVKGIDILLRACALLTNHTKNFTLHVIGDGSLRPWIEKECLRLHLTNHAILIGNQKQPIVAGYMMSADCLVIPSRHESLPLVIGEAARCNLPMIATDTGDCAMIQHYHAGVVVPTNNISALVYAMKRMAALGHAGKRLYSHGHRELNRVFNPKLAPKAILAIL